jgi:uncharacterized protein
LDSDSARVESGLVAASENWGVTVETDPIGEFVSIPFHVTAKPVGPRCNLACDYCFYLDNESMFPGGFRRMDDHVLEVFIRQVFEAHPNSEVVLTWQGGEPTLAGRDFFRRSVELVERYRRPGQPVVQSIQTNGILVDQAWARFFSEHRFLVGLSIDGPREVHDAYRVDRSGQGSFDRVMAGWEILQRYGVDVNVLCAVHAANEDHPLEVYRFLRDEIGARFLQFIPIVEWCDGGVSARTVSPDAFGRFLIGVFDEWVGVDVGEVFVQHFEAALAAWVGVPPPVCTFAKTCGLAPVLEHNGDVYACDHYVDSGHLLGNIDRDTLADLVASPAQRAFGRAKRETLHQACLQCEFRFACHGGCPKNRASVVQQGEVGLNYLCPGYRAFFGHVTPYLRIMASLLKHGREAREIMALVQSPV